MRWFMLTFCCLFSTFISYGQDTQTFVALEASTTDWSTGETVEVRLTVKDVPELWLLDVIIRYDPEQLYIIGTDSGSPFTAADMMPSDRAVTIFNQVEAGTIHYTRSMLAPADPVSGSGVIATLRVFPLKAGATELRFEQVQLLQVNFTTNEDGERIGEAPVPIDFLPALLPVTVSGDDVTPPPEFTATPTITPTSAPLVVATLPAEPSSTPLVNVTLAPPAPTLIPAIEADSSDSSGIVVLGGILMLIAVIGIGALLVMARRR